LYFHQPEDYWFLPPTDPEAWWADHFDIQVVRDAADWREGLKRELASRSSDIRAVAAIGDAPMLGEVFEADRVNPAGLVNRTHIARTRKTPYEIACMQQASHLAAVAHLAAERTFGEGRSEFEIHQAYLSACEHSDSQLPYGNIVALNEHGAVLHYQERERTVPGQIRSFLIDAGCTVHAYASDITRTYSSDAGEFAELISAMQVMQRGLIDRVTTGVDYRALHIRAHHEIADIMEAAGIINISADDAVDTGLSSVFYPHGLGHFIGLQTHDVAGLIDNEGQEIPRPDGHPFLRLTRILEPGNVLTIEPGLYFIEPLLRQWRENGDASAINWSKIEALSPYGGIRIEDNVVVTETGCDNLTQRAFAEAM
jgi:Xaa-Pro dipeptidase